MQGLGPAYDSGGAEDGTEDCSGSSTQGRAQPGSRGRVHVLVGHVGFVPAQPVANLVTKAIALLEAA